MQIPRVFVCLLSCCYLVVGRNYEKFFVGFSSHVNSALSWTVCDGGGNEIVGILRRRRKREKRREKNYTLVMYVASSNGSPKKYGILFILAIL